MTIFKLILVPQVIVNEFTANFIHLRILYWERTNDMKISTIRLKSNVMIKMLDTFREKGYSIPNSSVPVIKIQQDNSNSSTQAANEDTVKK